MDLDHEPTQTYRCQGCSGTSDSRETMEHHEAGCVLALRVTIAAQDASIANLLVRVAGLEAEQQRRWSAEQIRALEDDARADLEDFRAEYRHRRQEHEARMAWEEEHR